MDQWITLINSNINELDTELQELVYYSYYQFVYRDIYSLVRDHATTEDIIQDAFIKISQKGPHSHPLNLKGWVRTVTRNVTFDWIRKSKYIHLVCFNEHVIQAATSLGGPESDVERKIRNELLHQTINELKPEYRSVIFLYYIEEMSYREICLELILSEQVVAQRLARARKKLLQRFSRKWVDFN
ncbi:MAG TPA: sigma-70 family RNA polymerase sigma factor [Paenibacillus sp.]